MEDLLWKIKAFGSSFFTIVFYVLFAYGEIFGVIHSIKKHSESDGLSSIFFPPMAWYRSVEMWFDKDNGQEVAYATLQMDKISCLYLVCDSGDDLSPEMNEKVLKFVCKIKGYEAEQYNELKNFSHLYIEYIYSMCDDLSNSAMLFGNVDSFKITTSSRTRALEEKLKHQLNSHDPAIDKYLGINAKVEQYIKSRPQDEYEKFRGKAISGMTEWSNGFIDGYKRVFKVDFAAQK